MTHASSVVMYSPDTIGLGHVRRHSTIATELVALRPNVNVVMLIGSGAGAYFDLPSGVDSVKIPSVQKTGQGSWRARSLGLSWDATRRIRSGLIRETIDALRPDVFLVDHLPAGIWGELLPVFRFIKQSSPKTRIVLGLRDIIDDVVDVKERWEADGTYDILREFYGSVFIYGDRRVFATAEKYGITSRICPDVQYMGYITQSGTVTKAPEHGGPRGHLQRRRSMLVTAGGGHDAHPMMSKVLAGLAAISVELRPDTTMITGPLMAADLRANLMAEGERLGVTVIAHTPHVKRHIEDADLVVTMGGYNSMIETMISGKPTLNIPRPGPSQEQSMRARIFDDMGLLRFLPLHAATPGAVSEAILSGLTMDCRKAPPQVSLEGAKKAAQRLASMLPSDARAHRFEAAKAELDAAHAAI